MSASTSTGRTEYCDTNGDNLNCMSDEINELNSLSGHAPACISSATMPTSSSSTATSVSPLVTTKIEIVHPTETQLLSSNEDEDNVAEDNDDESLLHNNSKINEVEK